MKKKQVGLFFIILGLSAILISVLITPSFATKYLSSDHDITTAGLKLLKSNRLLSALFGVFAIGFGASRVIIRPQRLNVIQNWLFSKLRNEKVLVAIIFIIGIVARVFHLPFVGINSPYKYGGLFLEFANQIASNGFLLPKNIPFYTNGGIPFAYPPLPFYIEAIAVHLLGVKPYAVVNFLPPVVAIISLLSFYYLTREAKLSKWSRTTALLAFAIMPNAFEQQIEGAGLAESFGTLALILFFVFLYRTHKHNKLVDYFAIGLSWALCIVSSPGSAYASVPLFLFFSIVLLLRRESVLNTVLRLALATMVALIISSPYWLTIIHNHGLELFLNSFSGQHNGFFGTINRSKEIILKFELIRGPYPFIWNLCVFIGAVYAYLKKRFMLLAWFIILVVLPREGSWALSIPSAILIGMGIELIIDSTAKTLNFKKFFRSKDEVYLYSGMLLVILWAAYSPVAIVKNNPFSPSSSLDTKIVEAMHWMQMNTNPNSKVVVISESHVQEWLPQISRRTVINIPYGSEWQPNEATSINKFLEEVNTCENLDCILSLSQMIVDLDHFILFIDKGKLDSLTINHNNASLDLLWENEVIAIGELSGY